MRLIFPDCTPELHRYYDDELRAILPGIEVRVEDLTPAQLVERTRGHHGIMHFNTKLPAEALAALPGLKLIVFLGTGVGSWVDLAAAQRLGIRVERVLGYGDRTIAEHTIALIFAAVRRIAALDRDLRAGAWRCDRFYDLNFELAGKTLGLIGLGGIGREMARMATALGMRAIGWNRGPVPADVPCLLKPLDAVLAEADIVSLHLGLNDETRGMIDRRRLGLMKPGAVFVNTARGGLVDEAALIEGLTDGRIAAAGLDVYAQEPLPADHPLTKLPNVTLTPHSAWVSPEASRRVLKLGLEIMRDAARELGDV